MPVSTCGQARRFRKMHERGCFVLPNPYDVGSAKALQHLGFKAIASTSAGFAWTIGKADNRITLEEVLAHLTALCAAVDIPVNADFEGGFAASPRRSQPMCGCGPDRRHRAVDRGFHRRAKKPLYERGACGRTDQGGARGDRCRQVRRDAGRPLRGVSVGQTDLSW